LAVKRDRDRVANLVHSHPRSNIGYVFNDYSSMVFKCPDTSIEWYHLICNR
jgi:hypothetical protein